MLVYFIHITQSIKLTVTTLLVIKSNIIIRCRLQLQCLINVSFPLKMTEMNADTRNIMIIGKLGAGKSHSGNGILGKKYFDSKQSFSLVTKECTCKSATRNDLHYRIVDTPGLNLSANMQKEINVKRDIRKCLMSTSPGFHAIVFVLSASERMTKEITRFIDDILGRHAYDHMIIIITKLKNDSDTLKKLMTEYPAVIELEKKCSNRLVIFGDDPENIPEECVKNFDDILSNLIKQNISLKKQFFSHGFNDRTRKILEENNKDKKNVEDNKASKIGHIKAAKEIRTISVADRPSFLTRLCNIL